MNSSTEQRLDAAGLWNAIPLGAKMSLGARDPLGAGAGERLTFTVGDGRRRLRARVRATVGTDLSVEVIRLKRVTDEVLPVEESVIMRGDLDEWLIGALHRTSMG